MREHVWLGNLPLATFMPDAAQGANAGTTTPLIYYIHADHLNTPRVLVDNTNTIRWKWMSEPFGTTVPESPAGQSPLTYNLRHPGQYFDSETGMFYNVQRDYVPGIGRYAQSDPIGLQGGINTYGYVEGNPVSLTDPLGLAVQLRCRPADIAAGLVNHCWLKTDTTEAGMNEQASCSRAGNDASGLPFQPVVVSDHSCDKPTIVTPLPNVNERCVNNELQLGKPLGRFAPPFNSCQTYTQDVIQKCSPSTINTPYIGYPRALRR